MKILTFLALAAGAGFSQNPPPHLSVSMISLGVTDMARSVRFYNETLGLPLAGSPGEVTLVRAGDVTIALNRPLGRAVKGEISGAVELIFPVESVTAALENLSARGCPFLNKPREITPGTWAASFADPDGHRLTIMGSR